MSHDAAYRDALARFAELVIADAQRQGGRIVVERKPIDREACVDGVRIHDLLQDLVAAITKRPAPDPTTAIHVNDVPIDDGMIVDLLAAIGTRLVAEHAAASLTR